MTTRSTWTPSCSSVAAKRSWVSGRSAARPWSRIAIALASQAPIQIGRDRSPSGSLRMTTCRLESMCTRTLSISISTSRAMWGLSRRSVTGSPAGNAEAQEPHQQPDGDAEQEAADVREERHAALRRLGAEARESVQELEREPEAEDDERRDLEQL